MDLSRSGFGDPRPKMTNVKEETELMAQEIQFIWSQKYMTFVAERVESSTVEKGVKNK